MLIRRRDARAGSTTIGDDIAWLKPGPDGYLRAINPNPAISASRRASYESTGTRWISCGPTSFHQRRAHRRRRRVVGGHDEAGAGIIDWQGKDARRRRNGRKAAHQCALPTVAAAQCPSLDPGVGRSERSISAFISARRSDTIPLIAAIRGRGRVQGGNDGLGNDRGRGRRRGRWRDPFAMPPFCGYHVGDYFQHWLNMGGGRAPAVHFQRELVPGREREIRVARLRPEHARAAGRVEAAGRACR
jgi:phosphoenolpyruvate carboxykinase (GTP)